MSAWVEKRENAIREEWVRSMELRITREALGKCQKLEGVNHYEKCKDLAVRYANMLREVQVNRVVQLSPLLKHTVQLRAPVHRSTGCEQ